MLNNLQFQIIWCKQIYHCPINDYYTANVLWPAHLCVVNRNGAFRFTEITKFKNNLKFTTMYALKNKVQLIGNLGNAPEIKNTESGKKLARFSIATNENYRNAKGEKVTETTWHNLVAWGKVADLSEKFLHKGTEVVIEGKLINRNYTDKDGIKKYISEVQVNELLLLNSKAQA